MRTAIAGGNKLVSRRSRQYRPVAPEGRAYGPQEERVSAANDRVAKLVTKLDMAWMEFQKAYAGLSEADLLKPGVTGEWSVRDLIAHVTWWDEEALKHLPVILAGGRPPRYSVQYGGIDAFNAMMTEQKRDLSLDEVLEAFTATHARLVDYILSLPPDQIVDNDRFKRRLRLDTYGHYPIHSRDIREWRTRRPAAT